MDSATYNAIVERVKTKGFDVSMLKVTEHNECK